MTIAIRRQRHGPFGAGSGEDATSALAGQSPAISCVSAGRIGFKKLIDNPCAPSPRRQLRHNPGRPPERRECQSRGGRSLRRRHRPRARRPPPVLQPPARLPEAPHRLCQRECFVQKRPDSWIPAATGHSADDRERDVPGDSGRPAIRPMRCELEVEAEGRAGLTARDAFICFGAAAAFRVSTDAA